ncbi:MAG: hypothetical protein OQK48_06330 [Sulfurimonas sp.]|uniref:hypothetical protein n=1 Tax=Sulfurimonas sp. TaxID=2022749 RepID=UPI002615B0FB|nr:hypothetical protein [Sulfurimonas sp.]MCW8896087.1 hypothetical protein [Sulfurimonas sp.]MCW8954548.1 hypothetical protein [Sulfurimonas sp.]
MKRQNIIFLALLFVMSFSIIHEYLFAIYDDDHCSASEYVLELESPSDHGDLCEIHFEYHSPYILTQNNVFSCVKQLDFTIFFKHDSYDFKASLDFLKPPIV